MSTGASREIIKGPAKIRDTWPSLNKAGFDEVDMVLPLPGDPSVAYFFSGANYAVVQIVPGSFLLIVPSCVEQRCDKLH